MEWHEPPRRKIRLDKRSRQNADRLAGIELLILIPGRPPPEPRLRRTGDERPTDPREHRRALAMLDLGDLRESGLKVRRTKVVLARRPTAPPFRRPGELALHYGIEIAGERWFHAHLRPDPIVTWHRDPQPFFWARATPPSRS